MGEAKPEVTTDYIVETLLEDAEQIADSLWFDMPAADVENLRAAAQRLRALEAERDEWKQRASILDAATNAVYRQEDRDRLRAQLAEAQQAVAKTELVDELVKAAKEAAHLLSHLNDEMGPLPGSMDARVKLVLAYFPLDRHRAREDEEKPK